MKHSLCIGIAAVTAVLTVSCSLKPNVEPAIPVDKALEARVDSTLRRMTLEDKIGQMCEITIDVVTDQKASLSSGRVVLDEEKLDTVLRQCKVGSLLNVPLSAAQPKEVWNQVIGKVQEHSIKANGIPDIYGVDQIHGASYTAGATLFPQEINQAASFNRTIPFRVSEITAYESRACSIPWVYSPVMDLGRNPAWSRQWESYGEDCFLNAAMAEQSVRGYQGENPNKIDKHHAGTCIKHYMAYGVPVSGKDRTPSSVTEREMREKYFKPFLQCVRAGAVSLMVNSAVNDGVPFHCNVKYLTQWLKDELNWDGVIVTDWADINNLYTRDRVAADRKEAIKLAINAGIDMSMEPYNVDFCTLLKELVDEGSVSTDRIDDAVRRILRLKFRLGLFDSPVMQPSDYQDFACAKFAQESLLMAEEGEVLLKNEGVLPLPKGTKILLAGPNANSMRCLNGGWSYTWQGQMTDVYAKDHNTIYEALCGKFGEKNVILEQGVTYVEDGNAFSPGAWMRENDPKIRKAVSAARRADVIIACVGENSYCETPGNLSDLSLSQNQRDLVKALAETGKPVILVLNGGRPRIVRDIEPLAKGVIDIMLPGNFGGDALANLISGDANFSAKLPFTYPRQPQSISTYDYKPCEFVSTMSGNYNYDAVLDVQWPFGFGLSYTTFAYSNFKVSKASFTADDELEFSIDVTNTGSAAGKEAVLLYSSDKVASVSPDNVRLRQFDKVDLKPGETKTVTLAINASDLAFVGADCKWVLEAGDFHIKCGDKSLDITCTETHRWETPNI